MTDVIDDTSERYLPIRRYAAGSRGVGRTTMRPSPVEQAGAVPARGAARVADAASAAASAAVDVASATASAATSAAPAAADITATTCRPDVARFGPLATYASDPAVTDIFVNGPDSLWLDRGRGLVREPLWSCPDGAALRDLAVRLVALGGRHIDESKPYN